ncbi:hypothetical protein CNR33_00048 [Pseudomonas phage tabernarius]|uniref:Uncharacterized protein n=1 Tax=Pseudomonas phage tabernarius TaxID=2048978 RepID=A0A2H4P6U0_9CAUD|nr:hypothetical protein FDJ17_gp48 [Pseudomonas phage tabernarius]ATW57894.1 hypothetical protein CNR33_00048 [Pseudomonas phage tabernarius]
MNFLQYAKGVLMQVETGLHIYPKAEAQQPEQFVAASSPALSLPGLDPVTDTSTAPDDGAGLPTMGAATTDAATTDATTDAPAADATASEAPAADATDSTASEAPAATADAPAATEAPADEAAQ